MLSNKPPTVSSRKFNSESRPSSGFGGVHKIVDSRVMKYKEHRDENRLRKQIDEKSNKSEENGR